MNKKKTCNWYSAVKTTTAIRRLTLIEVTHCAVLTVGSATFFAPVKLDKPDLYNEHNGKLTTKKVRN